MDTKFIESLKDSARVYRSEADQTNSCEDKEDMQRIASIAESLVLALEAGDMDLAKQKLGGFSRSVSDAYCIQPPSFKALAHQINGVRLD